jgi:quercetin dioxygenase-like cupin family protein
MVAEEDVEFLANCYGPWAFLRADHDRNNAPSVFGVLASKDITKGATDNGITLVPNTLAECMQPRPPAFEGKAEPMAIGSSNEAAAIVTATVDGIVKSRTALSPHSVDTKSLPWIVTPETPDVGLKIMRVSEETGTISLIVRHNGVAPPHYHLGAADFMVLSGRIGYRMGPAEGYGPGMWFYEPPGARHESTQSIGTDDLIYIANVYGPIQFDSGKDTPIAFILSWMQYKAMAEGFGSPLVKSTFPNDRTLLANSDGFGKLNEDIHLPKPQAKDTSTGGD